MHICTTMTCNRGEGLRAHSSPQQAERGTGKLCGVLAEMRHRAYAVLVLLLLALTVR